jgi:predicted lipoprotein
VNNLYSSVLTMMQVVEDQKIMIPLGKSLEGAKPALAESARAGRSLRNIALNLASMRAFMTGEKDSPGMLSLLPATPEATAAATTTEKAFDEAITAANAVPVPLGTAVTDPEQRPKVEALLGATKGALTMLNRTLPPLFGITLGFNELDGD